jgi:hypothetical protein
MKLTLIEIGRAIKLTRDYSGDFAWDAFAYDYRKYLPWN